MSTRYYKDIASHSALDFTEYQINRSYFFTQRLIVLLLKLNIDGKVNDSDLSDWSDISLFMLKSETKK